MCNRFTMKNDYAYHWIEPVSMCVWPLRNLTQISVLLPGRNWTDFVGFHMKNGAQHIPNEHNFLSQILRLRPWKKKKKIVYVTFSLNSIPPYTQV